MTSQSSEQGSQSLPDVPDFAKVILSRLFPQMVSYLPLIPLLTEIQNATDSVDRTRAVVRLLRFGASRTPLMLDDEMLDLLEPVLSTPQGSNLVRWLSTKLTAGIFAMEGPQP